MEQEIQDFRKNETPHVSDGLRFCIYAVCGNEEL